IRCEAPAPPRPSPTPEREPEPRPAPPIRPRSATRWRLGLGTHLSVGITPASVTVGFPLQVGLRRPAWSLSLEARGDVPTSHGAAGGQFSSTLIAGAAIGCWHYRWFAACGLVA